nr:hypothetical protein GCM10020092_024730 [Actinoplanes digitatis]
MRYGTDLGNGPLPPGVNPRELGALLRAGMDPAGILAAMTEPDLAEPTWLPSGLDLDPATFAESLARARVVTA